MPWVSKVKVNKPIAKPDGKFGFLGVSITNLTKKLLIT